jgi:5-methylcytosine-specific restriction endonuclease McrA
MFDSSRFTHAHQVLADTDRIVATERKLTLELLRKLREIERDKLYLVIGYSSMFDYCTGHLKYSEAAAVRRIRTARCLAEYPQILPLLDSGELNTTTVSMIAKHIKPDNAAVVIDAIKGKSTRDVDRFLAALQPVSVVPPDRVRPVVVPVKECAKSTIGADGKQSSTVEKLTSTDPAESPAATVIQNEVFEFKRMVRVDFTAQEELMQKLDRVRSLASHVLPANASLEQLITFMADFVIERKDPIRRQERRRARAANRPEATPPTVPTNPRQIPAAVRDEVFARDQRCTYVGLDGKRCNSSHVLQVDHIRPVARGGAAVIENLRVLCAYHNRLESERLMGKRGLSGASSKSAAP